VSRSVSVVNLLVLPVLGTVSTSGLYLMFSKVGQCRHRCKWIRRAVKHFRSRWDHLGIVFRRKGITTSGIRRTSWNFWVKEASGKVAIYIYISVEIASISVSVVTWLVLPVWSTVSTSGLYRMPSSEVGRCRYRWKSIGQACLKTVS